MERSSCCGCSRTCGVSPSYFDPSETVEWHREDGSGRWCAVCFRTWFNCFSHAVQLTYLPEWLEVAQNREEWQRHRLAMIMMRMENEGTKVVKKDLARTRSMDSVFRLLGFPLAPHILVPLRDFYTRPEFSALRLLRKTELQGNLTTIWHESCPRLAVWVPTEKVVMSGPCFNFEDLGIASLSGNVWAGDAEERRMAEELAGAVEGAAGTAAPTNQFQIVPLNVAAETSLQDRSALGVKFALASDKTKNALALFGALDWAAAKEPPLSGLIARWNNLLNEAAFEGREDLREQGAKFNQVLMHAKAWIKSYRT